uniref:Uncharacterized protein n=1 Tax=Pectinophora gossypiella TaxID=13191 RepID=A0A1E1VZF3_PECGO
MKNELFTRDGNDKNSTTRTLTDVNELCDSEIRSEALIIILQKVKHKPIRRPEAHARRRGATWTTASGCLQAPGSVWLEARGDVISGTQAPTAGCTTDTDSLPTCRSQPMYTQCTST